MLVQKTFPDFMACSSLAFYSASSNKSDRLFINTKEVSENDALSDCSESSAEKEGAHGANTYAHECPDKTPERAEG